MAIECVHVYRYSADKIFTDGLDLPLRDYSESQLAITNIEGVAPVSATVNITQYAARDGGIFNSSRRAERHITITMKLFSNPSMDAVRQKVFNAAPVGEAITLVFDWSDGVSKAIDGYVEDTPVDYFGDQEGIQIAVVCPDPDFRVVKKQEDQYQTVVNYKQVNYPNKTTLVDIGDDIDFEWVENCKDETERFDIDSVINLKNNTDLRQQYLFAIAFTGGWKELFVNFYSSDFEFIRKEVNEYIGGITEATWEPGIYFIETDTGYEEVETELHFDYLTQIYEALTQATEWEPNKYYEKSDAPETGKWMMVTWQASYTDEQDPTAFPYQVTYGFLTDFTQQGEILNSIVAIFDSEASFFTSAAKAFSVLSKSGTVLPSAQTWAEDTYYKIAREYVRFGGYCGWTLEKDDDPVYFYEDDPDPYYKNDILISMPLYGFSRIEKIYKVYGETYVKNKYYYMNGDTEVQLTANSAPSDWDQAVNKYYSKQNRFYEMTNFTDRTRIGGRYIYDVMLDYLTYKYEPINEVIPYESGLYYASVGDANPQILRGLYGFTIIPVYRKLEGSAPSDWGTPGKYFYRVRKTALEREEVLYFNDHAYSKIKNRAVIEYELLTDMPDDFQTNYSNYFTIADDYSNIIAYFTPDEYPNYSKEYDILTTMPSDWSENFGNYYSRTDDFSMLVEKTGSEMADVIPDGNADNIKSIISLMKTSEDETNFLLGDINGNIESYVYKGVSDQYYAGGYYLYDQQTQSYILLTSSTAPADFYSEPYKYFKKEVNKCNYIPKLTIIFYNPVAKQLEYDMDNYTMFINDFKSWAEHAMSPIISYYPSETGNRKNVRKDGFITYFVSGTDVLNGIPNLDPGNNYILSETSYSNGMPSYDHAKVIGIAAQIS